MEDKGSNKALTFLENAGLVQAYEYLLTSLCEHGLPTGDLYEFSALMVLKFEKKWKAKQRLNKAKPGQETSPVRKVEGHDQEQLKHEDKVTKAKEDKKGKDGKVEKKEEEKKNTVKEEKKGKVEEKKDEKKGEKNLKNEPSKGNEKGAKKEEEKKIAIEDKKEVKDRKKK